MKKLSLYVFLFLMFFSNLNAGLDSKDDKLTFDRCNGEKSFPVIGGLTWEINFEKRTLTLLQVIKIEGKDNNPEITKDVVFQERYHSEQAIHVDEPFIYIRECCDRTQYIFNMKTGKITQIAGWTGEKTFMMCKIVD